LLLLLAGLFLGCCLVNTVSAWRSVSGLELMPPAMVLISEGQRAWQPWKVINRGAHCAGLLHVTSSAGTLFKLLSLKPAQETRVVPDLVYERRGVYRHAQARLGSLYPFGLVRVTRRLALPGEIVVCPELYEVAPPKAAGYDVMVGGKHKGKHRTTSGADFAGVRPIQPGDPFKQIHWRSSAKGQGLMIKTFEEELSGRLSFVLDCGHAGNRDVLDNCLRAAGSLMFAALNAGHHVEWIDLTRLQAQLIPPMAHGQELLEALARIEPNRHCLEQDRLSTALDQLSNKSALHCLFTGYEPVVGTALAPLCRRGRAVCLYLPAGAPLPPLQGLEIYEYDEGKVAPA